MKEDNFELPKTPDDIFKVIVNQSVSKIDGEKLIELYGDQRVREAMADFNVQFGVEQEVCDTISRIENLLDEFYKKVIKIIPPRRNTSRNELS